MPETESFPHRVQKSDNPPPPPYRAESASLLRTGKGPAYRLKHDGAYHPYRGWTAKSICVDDMRNNHRMGKRADTTRIITARPIVASFQANQRDWRHANPLRLDSAR